MVWVRPRHTSIPFFRFGSYPSLLWCGCARDPLAHIIHPPPRARITHFLTPAHAPRCPAQMKEASIEPKLRTYHPILEAECVRGNVDAALALVPRMAADGVGLRSEQLTLILVAAARSGRLRDTACRAAVDALIATTAGELVGMEVAEMRRVVAAVGGLQVRVATLARLDAPPWPHPGTSTPLTPHSLPCRCALARLEGPSSSHIQAHQPSPYAL